MPNISCTGTVTATNFTGTASNATTILVAPSSASNNYYLLGTYTTNTVTNTVTTPTLNSSFYFNPASGTPPTLYAPNISCGTGTVTATNFTGTVSQATKFLVATSGSNINYYLLGTNATSTQTTPSVNTSFYFNPSSSNPYLAPTLVVPNISCGTGTVTATNFTGNATTATKATNIVGGLGGQLLYQSAVDTTAKLTNGSLNNILLSAGGTSAPVWTAGSIKGWAVTFSGLGTINNYLQPNSYFNLLATGFSAQDQSTSYIMPEGATITKLSTLVSSTSATATFKIFTGTYGSAQNVFTSTVNTQFATISNILTLPTSISVSAGNAVYVQIAAALPTITDVASITLYFS